ncbi:MAG TPA: aminopeptidase P family protein [Rikenellaceae bacterium]|nr:aminopeptidase P family protein [Rikenellaceae bacterium]
MENIHLQRIESLRALMRAKDWDAVVITGSDPHSSEYPALRWKQVEWLTGFTGEAGDLVVTQDHAGLWTDSRYFIQAVNQLSGTGVELHKTRVPDQVLIPEWLCQQFSDQGIIALDGLCASASWVETIPGDIISIPNLLSMLWKDRPEIPQTPIFSIECGESRMSKLQWLREYLSNHGCSAMLVSSLDEIAWLLNMRASDIEFNPLIISYLLIAEDSAVWFVRKDGTTDESTEASLSILSSEGVSIESYDSASYLIPDMVEGSLMIDADTLNYELYHNLLSSGIELRKVSSPIQKRKAVKNDFEIDAMRRIHVKDGVAMEKFLYWIERSLSSRREIDEWDAAVKLGNFRSEIEEYRGDSFETISAYGPCAALPHYITPYSNAPKLRSSGLYLCDSGGQYSLGTTDITRTVPLGPCSRLEMEDYTLVLKGHIDLAMAVFPEGTPGCRLDALSREPLWRRKRNFGHGTGHGVGFFLGVHEGPQDIRQNMNSTALEPGMICSDEPGIYREGKHGVRHENLLLCVEDGSNEFGRWLCFEPLTVCHFDTSAILVEFLNEDEIAWLNAYNEKVYRTLAPLLPTEVREWLRGMTLSLSPQSRG